MRGVEPGRRAADIMRDVLERQHVEFEERRSELALATAVGYAAGRRDAADRLPVDPQIQEVIDAALSMCGYPVEEWVRSIPDVDEELSSDDDEQ